MIVEGDNTWLVFDLVQVMLLIDKMEEMVLLHQNIKTLFICLKIKCMLMNHRNIRDNMNKFVLYHSKCHHY